jgi:hypothetical protein
MTNRPTLTNDELITELAEALEWALNQIEDDLDPDHQAAMKAARWTLAQAEARS